MTDNRDNRRPRPRWRSGLLRQKSTAEEGNHPDSHLETAMISPLYSRRGGLKGSAFWRIALNNALSLAPLRTVRLGHLNGDLKGSFTCMSKWVCMLRHAFASRSAGPAYARLFPQRWEYGSPWYGLQSGAACLTRVGALFCCICPKVFLRVMLGQRFRVSSTIFHPAIWGQGGPKLATNDGFARRGHLFLKAFPEFAAGGFDRVALRPEGRVV